MEKKITIVATSKGAEIKLEYKGKTYIQKCIPNSSGATYEGCNFDDEKEIPECISDELTGFIGYNLIEALRKSR